MNISEFKRTYATNANRVALFDELLKFIEKANEYLNPYHIAVYGSYITNKPSPADIDVIIQGFVRKDKWCEYNPDMFRLESPVHVKPFITISIADEYHLKPMETIINEFSNTEENKTNIFKIDNYEKISF